MASIWDILDMTPSQDSKKIKEAYAKQLKLAHPEEDPQGFKDLREAYAQALKMARREASFSEEAGQVDFEEESSFEDLTEFEDLENDLAHLEATDNFINEELIRLGYQYDFKEALATFELINRDNAIDKSYAYERLEEHFLNSYLYGVWTDRLLLVEFCQETGLNKAATYIRSIGLIKEEQEGQETYREGGLLV